MPACAAACPTSLPGSMCPHHPSRSSPRLAPRTRSTSSAPPAHATRLSALDGLRRTIYVGGFAKILAPNWRIGFLAAPPELVEQLLDTKLLGTLTTPALLEKALALCIDQGQLRRHSERIRTRLDLARARSVKLALNAGCRFA